MSPASPKGYAGASGAQVTAMEIAEAAGKHKTSIMRRANKEGWTAESVVVMGGKQHTYPLNDLPADIQKALINNMDVSMDMIPMLAPEAAISAAMKLQEIQQPNFAVQNSSDAWSDDTAISEDVLTDPRVRRIARIVQEALEVPRGWKKSKWLNAVAMKHSVAKQTIYKWIKKYEKKGLAGLQHTKKNRGQPKVWAPEAIDWWVGLCLKREHRKIARDALYEILTMEAHKRGWKIGCYESALGWYNKKATPQLLALQRGGMRALDNTLPPVLRSYADLAPFEILVGDQHRFDFWVMDDDTGEVFRPEGYFWQDLRTRCFYGGAVDKRYDSHLIGLALRIGIIKLGAFGSIYTDHGKPELSRYIMGVLAAMRTLGLGAEQTVEAPLDLSKSDPETVNPCFTLPGTHRKAIVRNAKAKMIEGTFNVLEGILRDHFQVPGGVKRLTASGEEQDVDQKEIQSLALNGKLLTFSEFVLTVYRAMDYYNFEKVHRGVIREWTWRPKPKQVTPMDCLKACFLEKDGWRPRRLSPEDVDMVFLARADRDGRVVDRGRISLNNRPYEHDNLIELHKTRVDVRYDPMDPEWVLCFHEGEFICRAVPVEYSSMKDMDLATRKIKEKASRRKAVAQTYRKLTTQVPDFLEYSQVPAEDKAPALLGSAKRKAQIAEAEQCRPRTEEELATDLARIESYHAADRPVFDNIEDRYQWCLMQLVDGKPLIEKDQRFVKETEAGMDSGTKAYWEVFKESIGINGSDLEEAIL